MSPLGSFVFLALLVASAMSMWTLDDDYYTSPYRRFGGYGGYGLPTRSVYGARRIYQPYNRFGGGYRVINRIGLGGYGYGGGYGLGYGYGYDDFGKKK